MKVADLIGIVGDVLAMQIATVGTTAISLGLVAAGSLAFGLAVSVFRRIKGR